MSTRLVYKYFLGGFIFPIFIQIAGPSFKTRFGLLDSDVYKCRL
jgi:hypothetical protein